jgi:hypothetical protein
MLEDRCSDIWVGINLALKGSVDVQMRYWSMRALSKLGKSNSVSMRKTGETLKELEIRHGVVAAKKRRSRKVTGMLHL